MPTPADFPFIERTHSTAVWVLGVIRNLDRSIPDQFPEICEEQKRTWTSCNLYHHLPKIPLKSPDSTQLWKFGSRGMDRDLGSSRCLDISGLKSKKIYSFKGNLEKKFNFFFFDVSNNPIIETSSLLIRRITRNKYCNAIMKSCSLWFKSRQLKY